tara:strand:- start:57 stop:317 length:261 start_codon:yes stop_codon:yes gene_type:complete
MIPMDGESPAASGITIASRAHETHGPYGGGGLMIRLEGSSHVTMSFYEIRSVAMWAGLGSNAEAEVQKLATLQINLRNESAHKWGF